MSGVNVIEKERTLTINPLKTCQPLGAMFAVMGVYHGLPMVHGSQGCSTFVRYNFARHFREPAEIAVSSLHEDAAVFGGRKNINMGIKNLALRFKPDLIGAITTCSSEIIGDDVFGFVDTTKKELKEMSEDVKGLDKIEVIPIPTPSFVGNHFTGYDIGVNSLVSGLAEHGEPTEKVNIIPGMVNPGDIREIKHILALMGIEGLILTDTSDPFDSPLRPSVTPTKPYFPKGGTTVDEIRDSANSQGTIALCKYAGTGATSLEKKHEVPAIIESPPIGLQNTDQFLRNLKILTDCEIPDSILDERGILVDLIADNAARYLFGRKVAIYGDPDITTGMARFVGELGMEPTMVCTGANSKTFTPDMEKISKETGCDIDVLFEQDMRSFEVYVQENPVDLIIGPSDGRLLAQDLGIPLIRAGFPVYDRIGYHRHPIVGYNGAARLMEMITNTVLEKYYEPTHWKLQQ
ncbi:MAG: nitrogenase molybdenum-iron protein subunit beta [Methanobacterium sp.]|jgi:nitrogenase molybdenum-iron protein beta chain|uniref:nitrogenase component 1 n=1 Tax=Methanobacterium sp. TaxID=2164 RepID=UPI00258FD3DA|nr:nitrogenase component 1 [Methanobacterium sp.]MCC7560596.1 nitrogenase molybdenum-iron protein subunit beta [Methanobacterium sp.]